MTTETTEEESEAVQTKESNTDRRRDALLKKLRKAHDWRVQVWAQSELRIRAMNAELVEMGLEPFSPYEAQFGDDDMLRHYAEMSLG